MGAFLVSRLVLADGPACEMLAGGSSVAADRLRAVDGDTLRGPGGSYRLIGVNTPELTPPALPGRPEPLAEAARALVTAWLAATDRVRLVAGLEQRDRHGRLLVHAYSGDGQLLAERLLADGLGFRIAVPPNLRLQQCLQAAESQAVARRQGVWGHAYFRPRRAGQLMPADQGFRLVRGRLLRVGRSRHAVWLEMEGDLVLRARHGVLTEPQRQVGNELLVRGWLIDRAARGRLESGRARYMIDIPHDSAITLP